MIPAARSALITVKIITSANYPNEPAFFGTFRITTPE